MAKKQYLEYQVHMTDEALVASLNAQYPNGVIRAPYDPGPPVGGMAVEASNLMGTGPTPFPVLEVGDAFQTPSLTSSWFTSNQFPRDVAKFRHTGGFFGGSGDTEFFWVARFKYSPEAPVDVSDPSDPATGEISDDTTEVADIPARFFLVGGEQVDAAEGATTNSLDISTAAARFKDDFGLVFASDSTATKEQVVQSATGDNRHGVWDRFYFRAQALPTTSEECFRVVNFSSSGTGFGLDITASGQVALYRWTTLTARTLIGTAGTITVGQRHRFDVFTYMGPDPADGTTGLLAIKVLLDRVPILEGDTEQGGIVANIEHTQSRLGRSATAPVANVAVFEFDDWINAAIPKDKDFALEVWEEGSYDADDYVRWDGPFRPEGCTSDAGFEVFKATATTTDPPRKTSGEMNAGWVLVTAPADWIGSRIIPCRATGFGTGHNASDWNDDADWRMISAAPRNSSATSSATSTTSGAVYQVTTDLVDRLSQCPGVIGIAAVQVMSQSAKTAAAADGTTAAALTGGGTATTSDTEATAIASGWRQAIANVASDAPWDVAALTCSYTKGADTSSSTLAALLATVEVIGAFGDEDVRVTPDSAGALNPAHYHTRHVPGSPWHSNGIAPFAPVYVIAGTYTGNATGQDVTLPVPPTWVWIRPHGQTSDPWWWFSTMQSGRKEGEQASGYPDFRILQNPDYAASDDDDDDQQMEFIMRIGGDDASLNADGVTYQYVAFCDPGARFSRNGVFNGGSNLAPLTLALEDSGFEALVGFVTKEIIGTTATTTAYFKGTGHATAGAGLLSTGALLTKGITFGEGTLKVDEDFLTATDYEQFAYSLFRRSDGNDDAGEPGVFVCGTYVGDGSASRTIGFSPATGKRPLWILVVPQATSTAHYRDPSHTGTTSQTVAGAAQASTGISAGSIDGFTVGSSLNANGTTYSWFGFVGGTTAGNNGWSANGTFTPVKPDSSNSPDYQDPDTAVPSEDFPPDDGTGDGDGETPDLGEEPDFTDDVALPGTDDFCVTFSQKIANLALAKIGVSKFIDAIATDLTTEARLARLHMKSSVEYVLSRFPWPFATKHATLTLVDGTASDPVNQDWTYSYRRPTDCVFARRIVATRNGAVDPTPPAMALGRDANGGLLFTNEASAKLEYTARGLCPAYEGDDLFKEALAWKLAAEFAPALTRLEGKVTHALEQLEATIAHAYEVLRPATPGPVEEVAADALDQAATAAAANLTVINRALIRIGARTIGAITQDSREARSVRAIFEAELKTVLRAHAWDFATRYAELALVAGPATWDEPLVQAWSATRTYEEHDAVVSGGTVYYALRQTVGDTPATSTSDWTTTEPSEANPDWIRGYRVPSASVFARRLVKPGARRSYDDAPYAFKLGTDDGGEVLFTDAEAAVLEYTARFDGIVAKSDALFRDALAWRLAHALAPSLAQVDPEAVEQIGRGADATALEGKRASVQASKAAARERTTRYALAMYERTLELAKVVNQNEQQEPRDGDAPWIAER